MLKRHPRPLTGLLVAALVLGCRPPDAGRGDTAAHAFLALAAAEDARPAGGRNLETLVEGEDAASPPLRAAAVRALGRLEDPGVLERIEPLLDDPDPGVRAEAANALAQSVSRGSGHIVVPPLLVRMDVERDPWVRGVLARSLGRLAVDGDVRNEVALSLLALTRSGNGSDPPQDQLLGAVLGIESFARRERGHPLGAALGARLRSLAEYRDVAADSLTAARIREVAVLALGASGDLDTHDIGGSLADPAWQVRRVAAARLLTTDRATRDELIAISLGDPSAPVRMEGVRAMARSPADRLDCGRLLSKAASDPDTGVRLAALDGLARPCSELAAETRFLTETAASLVPGDRLHWHAPAHALVALARVDPRAARSLIAPFATHADPFVRMYAARAAGPAGAGSVLAGLVDDSVSNVRTEAVRQLADVRGREADTVLVRVLGSADEPQLLLTTAQLLAGTPLRTEATEAALSTLARVSKTRRETLRDARLALLDLVETAGDEHDLPRLEPYLLDYDPAVADKAAAVMKSWTGDPYLAAPRRARRLALPTAHELRAMEHGTVVLHMARGGTIDIRLLPLVAPTNAWRLYQQARDGTLDGLTFHRVVANFVIQGGSLDANEYSGHGAFTRDELGLTAQWRGTVGLSTRGRDTGDGQFYVNLVDDVRLDHDYTVLGVVTSGMDVVDAVLEGDVIERAEVDPGS